MRLIIISNRLPVIVHHSGEAIQLSRSIGGIATGLSSYVSNIYSGTTPFTDHIWIGWAGSVVEPYARQSVADHMYRTDRCIPVFLEEETINGFYNVFCGQVLWPLLHHMPEQVRNGLAHWKHYVKANMQFFEVLKQHFRKDDVIWIHDYHLMLLPAMIRNEFPDAAVSFFLHSPFPSWQEFFWLPAALRASLLDGLWGADLIGFHIPAYQYNFEKCLQHLPETSPAMNGLPGNRDVILRTRPMGVDYHALRALSASDAVTQLCSKWEHTCAPCRIILSVDRLDYTKGILNRLLAFSSLLEKHPEQRGRITMLLVVAPSREHIPGYRELKPQIERLVQSVNSAYGRECWVPVVYQYRQLGLEEMLAVYRACDIVLITPLRDGMNLIAKEFVCAQQHKNGVLILSRTAGAIHELTGAIPVNPYDIEDIMTAIHTALHMTEDEKSERIRQMQEKLQAYDVAKWAADTIALNTIPFLPAFDQI